MSAILLITAFLIAQQQAPLTIDGVVAKAGTSEPVARAIVELRKLGNPPSPPTLLTTGADGRFEFNSVVPGRYQLTYSRIGYVAGSVGSMRELTVQGSSLRNLRLSLTQTGAISGRVFDGAGDPLARVSVQALKYNWEDGHRTLREVQSAETNDRGEFRLFWLPPGRYYLRTNSPEGFDMSSSPDGKFMVLRHSDGGFGLTTTKLTELVHSNGDSYAPVYYPGTVDAHAALAVDLGSGADIGGMDFVLLRAVTRRVRATVIDGVSGLPVPNPQLTLIPRSGSGSGTALFPTDGAAFEARGVLPGAYFLMATARISAGDNSFWVRGGRIPVDVADRDIDGISVVLQNAAVISGRVIVEGGQADSHPVVSLRRTPEGGPMNSELHAEFPDNQQFSIDSILEGDYRAQVSDLPQGTYVKSIRMNGTEVLNDSFYVDPRARHNLEIVLGANAGSIAGTVAGAPATPGGSQLFTRASVALVPAGGAARERPDLFRDAQTDESGRFEIDRIAPGDYLLFAWEDIDEALWRDPEFIRRSERLGRLVRIPEGGRETAELTVLSVQ